MSENLYPCEQGTNKTLQPPAGRLEGEIPVDGLCKAFRIVTLEVSPDGEVVSHISPETQAAPVSQPKKLAIRETALDDDPLAQGDDNVTEFIIVAK